MATRCVSVIVGAHQPVVLCGLVSILRAEPDFTVIASCREGIACLEAIRDLSPDLAVLSASLPDQGAVQVLSALGSEQLGTQVILLSDSPDSSGATDLLAKGACCVLSMETPLDILVRCLREAPHGQKALLIHKPLNGHNHSPRSRVEGASVMLTERERQIMQLVREGLSNKDIGRQCNLSDGTVKVHLHHIYEKLAIRNRTALAVLAAGDLHGAGGNGEANDYLVNPQKATSPISIIEAASRLRPKID
jgi:two-component system, NarL family, nitrate/nitrite response regulator NarL